LNRDDKIIVDAARRVRQVSVARRKLPKVFISDDEIEAGVVIPECELLIENRG
jgi:hypothetical protein